MTIAEAREKCKSLFARVPRDVVILGVLLGASSASFWFGYLAGTEAGQGSDTSQTDSPIANNLNDTTTSSTTGKIVASKNGTKYYLSECSGADRISDANKVWFASAALASAAGYTPAANCKGL